MRSPVLEEEDAARVESMLFRLARACWILRIARKPKQALTWPWRKLEVVLKGCDLADASFWCKKRYKTCRPNKSLAKHLSSHVVQGPSASPTYILLDAKTLSVDELPQVIDAETR